MDEWPVIRNRLNEVLTDQYKTNIQTIWPKEIQDLLILLKLVHPKAGRNIMTVLAFTKAMDKLIIFREVSYTI